MIDTLSNKSNSNYLSHTGYMKYIFTLLFLYCTSNFCFAQYNETIRTGRPGQSIGAFTVGKNILQFQQGFDYYTSFERNTVRGFLSNSVIRYGVLETVEFSALIDYRYQDNNLEAFNSTLSGLSNLQLGFRVHINEQKGWIPVTGFQMRLKIPHVSQDFESNHLAPTMVFVANWALPKKMSFATNWIISYDGNSPEPTGKYVLNFGFPITKKLNGFIGNYSQIRNSIFQTRFEGGLAYLVNNNLLIDVFSGYGNNQNVEDYFISTGVSYRIIGSNR